MVLGVGITLRPAPALGSDGYSTLVYGITLATDLPFAAINIKVSVAFVLAAWLRGVRPGIGSLVQMLVVGATVTTLLAVVPAPEAWWARALMLLVAFPVAAVGIALYLGSQLGADRSRPR